MWTAQFLHNQIKETEAKLKNRFDCLCSTDKKEYQNQYINLEYLDKDTKTSYMLNSNTTMANFPCHHIRL